EHVPRPAAMTATLARALRPGGALFVSTINRNLRSFLLAIVGAEYLLGLIPRGTHEYERLILPSELARWARAAGLTLQSLAGIERPAGRGPPEAPGAVRNAPAGRVRFARRRDTAHQQRVVPASGARGPRARPGPRPGRTQGARAGHRAAGGAAARRARAHRGAGAGARARAPRRRRHPAHPARDARRRPGAAAARDAQSGHRAAPPRGPRPLGRAHAAPPGGACRPQ